MVSEIYIYIYFFLFIKASTQSCEIALVMSDDVMIFPQMLMCVWFSSFALSPLCSVSLLVIFPKLCLIK